MVLKIRGALDALGAFSKRSLAGYCSLEHAHAAPPPTLAAATGALSVGVGFLPVIGAERSLGPLITGAMVSLLAAAAALLQPRAGRAHDDGRIGDRTGRPEGLW